MEQKYVHWETQDSVEMLDSKAFIEKQMNVLRERLYKNTWNARNKHYLNMEERIN